jgi:poly(A) polymerase
MAEPLILARAEHQISRRNIDPDALRVLYRLKEAGFTAYLVGGSVRDLLLGRKPKDFDISTSAHPYQVKRLFRNCFIIGRRFRLAHIKFGSKVIEVATFRRQVLPTDTEKLSSEPGDLLIRHDNTFGTPEEDAFRRDFTINALAYDIATFSIIDYVGGLEDLRAKVVRSIGNPDDRFREDPVRMLRAIAFATRLGFRVDPPSYDALKRHRMELERSSPARLLEEYYKILRSGAAERTFRALAEVGLLEPVTPALQHGACDRLWKSLADVDRYRERFETAPPSLTTAILAGSLLVPLGFTADLYARREPVDQVSSRALLGPLPVARKDLERLRHVLLLQRRLRDGSLPPRTARGVMTRSAFPDALAWLDVHGGAPELVARWRTLSNVPVTPESPGLGLKPIAPRHQRRRRRRRFPTPPRT